MAGTPVQHRTTLRRLLAVCLAIAWIFTSVSAALTQASASGLYVYPRNSQSVDVQSSDDWHCNRSAVEVTGYDPDNPPAYTPPQPDRAAQGRTLAKNAVVGSAASSAVGAAAGAAIGQAARGAAVGAAGGGMAGLIRGLFSVFNQSGRQEQQQQHIQQQRVHDYQRAFTACMDARGYSVQ